VHAAPFAVDVPSAVNASKISGNLADAGVPAIGDVPAAIFVPALAGVPCCY
jgi:hypothetical protein